MTKSENKRFLVVKDLSKDIGIEKMKLLLIAFALYSLGLTCTCLSVKQQRENTLESLDSEIKANDYAEGLRLRRQFGGYYNRYGGYPGRFGGHPGGYGGFGGFPIGGGGGYAGSSSRAQASASSSSFGGGFGFGR